MSFLSAIGNFFRVLGHDVQSGTNFIQPFAPIIESIPAVGGPFGIVFNAVVALEKLIPQDKQGPVKKAAAVTIIQNQLPNITEEKITNSVNDLVKLLNDFSTMTTPPAVSK